MHQPSKTAVVTGAGSGIGRCVALTLLQRGYQVVLAGRRPEPLHETAALGEAKGSKALVVPTDVTRSAAVAHLFEKAVSAYGRVDVLFNNAGIASLTAAFEDIKEEEWNKVIEVNLTGAFLMAQGAFRVMKQQNPKGGRIINNGSISSQVPRPNSAPYTATKHAITGLTKSLSLDGRKYRIACGQIDIGNADTSMVRAMTSGVLQANGSTMAEPTIAVDHIGEAVAYMASLPLDANVQFMTIMATTMPFIGRG